MCNRLNMHTQAYERFCEIVFEKQVSVTKFGLPKNGQIDHCNITFFGGQLTFTCWKSSVHHEICTCCKYKLMYTQ